MEKGLWLATRHGLVKEKRFCHLWLGNGRLQVGKQKLARLVSLIYFCLVFFFKFFLPAVMTSLLLVGLDGFADLMVLVFPELEIGRAHV